MPEKIWPDAILPKLLLVYGQGWEHGDAQIHGTSDALRRLGEACIVASGKPEGHSVSVDMMATDGEGYSVSITTRQEHGMARLPSHYCQDRTFD